MERSSGHSLRNCFKRIQTLCAMRYVIFHKGAIATCTPVNIHNLLAFQWDHTSIKHDKAVLEITCQWHKTHKIWFMPSTPTPKLYRKRIV